MHASGSIVGLGVEQVALTERPEVNKGIKAFIVGISDYTVLPGEGEPSGPQGTFGMKKLKTGADGAFRFLNWLLDADRRGGRADPLARFGGGAWARGGGRGT